MPTEVLAESQVFKQQIQKLCRQITERAHRGESGQDITRKLVQEVKNVLYK